MKRARLNALLILALLIACRRSPGLREVASVDTAGWAHDLAILGDSLYVSDRQGGFAVFDRRDFGLPPKIASPVEDIISLSPNSGSPILAARFQGIVLTSPSGQILDRRVYEGDIANGVETRGNLAYAAYGRHGLVIYRISGSTLQPLNELATPGWSHSIRLCKNLAILADWNYGLRVADISNPGKLREIGVLKTPATSFKVDLHEQDGKLLAAVAEGYAGVAIAEIDAVGRPSLVSRIGFGLKPGDAPHPETGGGIHGVAWSGRYIFAANWKLGLAVIDAENIRAPRIIVEHHTGGTAVAVAAESLPDGTSRSILPTANPASVFLPSNE
jgi:hypothetical protein